MIRVFAVVVLAGCSPVLEMPTPVAYPGACPADDYKCQRNADAQTLAYIGENEAAKNLMCSDPALSLFMGTRCNVLPVLY